jgi:hypothetical protein
MFEMRQLCYTMIGKVIPERKASHHSKVHWTLGLCATLRASSFLRLSLFPLERGSPERPSASNAHYGLHQHVIQAKTSIICQTYPYFR